MCIRDRSKGGLCGTSAAKPWFWTALVGQGGLCLADDWRKSSLCGYRHQDRICRWSLLQVFGWCCYGCFVYDGQRSCTGGSRSAGISWNQAALGAIYQPAARLCVSLQRPAERKNVIYQTRCQEPYSASGTFFVNLIKKSLTIRLWQNCQKYSYFLWCEAGTIWYSRTSWDHVLWWNGTG